MHYFQAYNLTIKSEIFLPELINIAEQKEDVNVTYGKIDRSKLKQQKPGYYSYVTPQEAYFAWDNIGSFSIKNGKKIVVQPDPKGEEREIRLGLLGFVFGILLYQRGVFPLHASAIAINGSAVVFMADRGMGKSTLAATLSERGHKLISDDLVAIDLSNPVSPLVLPAFPRLKLLPESVTAALNKSPEDFPILAKGYKKKACQFNERFVQTTLPLKGIYQLAKGTELTTTKYSPQEAFINLLSNSYVRSIIHNLREADEARLHFLQANQIVNNIPIYKLERPRSLELLSKLADVIEANLTQNNQLARA